LHRRLLEFAIERLRFTQICQANDVRQARVAGIVRQYKTFPTDGDIQRLKNRFSEPGAKFSRDENEQELRLDAIYIS
jgi:hypothetical protein